MAILNLAAPNRSDIIFSIIQFSDTQIQIDIKQFNRREQIVIYSRMSWSDLQVIIAATATLREMGAEQIGLYVPYFLGARSDRKFSNNSVNYLKKVIAPIINSLHLRFVLTTDPHSHVLEGVINNFSEGSNKQLAEFAIQDIYGDTARQDYVLLSPDAGAEKKVYGIAQQIGFKGEIVTASKRRDIATGNIIETIIPHNDFNGRDVIIIDDICDGGATFIRLANSLQHKNTGKIYLIVTHGIFSKGHAVLTPYFDGIYTTNSVRDFAEFEHDSYKLKSTHPLKAYNIF